MNGVIRALWFVFVGWWLALLWFFLCIALMGSIVFFPVGAYAIMKTWHIATLKTTPTVVIQDARNRADDAAE